MATIYFSMNEFPDQVKGEHFSETVLIYDLEEKDVDLGFYNYESKKWMPLGGMQMKLNCWCYPPKPDIRISKNKNFKPVITD